MSDYKEKDYWVKIDNHWTIGYCDEDDMWWFIGSEKPENLNKDAIVGDEIKRMGVETSINKALHKHIVSESMSIGDSFILQVKKPKCTVGQEYTVYKKVEQVGEKTEYWFLNDHDKPKTLYEGEYSR
jgi:hypothetical protein